MRVDFGEFKWWLTALAVVVAAIFCGIGILFIKVDIFTRLDPDHPMVKRFKQFHKKFGIIFIVFALVWLAIFLAAIHQQ